MPDVAASPAPDRRGPSLVASTGDVPQGTLLNVPSAPTGGPTPTAPVVAVNTVHWYQDSVLWTTIGGAALALEPVIEDALKQQTFNWKSFTLSCILALAAWLRNRTNSVVK